LEVLQPVMIQSFQNKLQIKPYSKLDTSASQRDTFVPGKINYQASSEDKKLSLWIKIAIVIVKVDSN
jgi:hypothetical protein